MTMPATVPEPCRNCATPEECHPDCPHRQDRLSSFITEKALNAAASDNCDACPMYPHCRPTLRFMCLSRSLLERLATETKRADDNFLAAARHGDDFLMAHGKARILKDERDALESKLAEAVAILESMTAGIELLRSASFPQRFRDCVGGAMVGQDGMADKNARAFLTRIAAETEAK